MKRIPNFAPALNELPSPSPGFSGWPWTEANSQHSQETSNGSPWPRISIVTPSYNQGRFLEETIRSVLLQGYPNLEYIIIDGGSTDGSVDIIRKYEKWLSYWVSQPDQGQPDALNQGFQRATGSILAWINSDDSYLPGAFSDRALELVNDPGLAMVYGDCHYVDEAGHKTNEWSSRQTSVRELLLDGNQIPQQSTFMRASTYKEVGGIDRQLHFVMDYTFWLRLGLAGRMKYIPGAVANFRKHRLSKGSLEGYAFITEELNWLASWADLERVLSDSERQEMFRRKHITAALYAALEGNAATAAGHLDAALQDGTFPYGDGNALALKMVYFGGMGGGRILDCRERYAILARAISRIESAHMRSHLSGRVAAQYHLARAHLESQQNHPETSFVHLLQALCFSPRQIKKRDFWDGMGRVFRFPSLGRGRILTRAENEN
jgi:GT2 family glycosyltransferase